MTWEWLDRRPIIVAIVGPNGAGKTTFYNAHIASAGLRFINADILAKEIDIDAYTAAKLTSALRNELVKSGQSFVFETVFSDPVGEKVAFLKSAVDKGYNVVVCFIALENSSLSEERVAMRVSQGGHDVPSDKLKSRFPRTMTNLKAATAQLPYVAIFDNSDLSASFQLVELFEHGVARHKKKFLPKWMKSALR